VPSDGETPLGQRRWGDDIQTVGPGIERVRVERDVIEVWIYHRNRSGLDDAAVDVDTVRIDGHTSWETDT